MFSPSHLKNLQVFSLKSSSSPSSTLSSMKLKSLIHTLIISQMCRIIRALSKFKTVIVEILMDNQKKRHCSRRRKIILGSFRLHYNWCSSKSSHILPVPAPVYEGASATHLYYDSNWNTVIPQGEQQDSEDNCPESQLAGYLRWLEEKGRDGNFGKGTTNEKEINEIDMLAEMFIANCHEKFRLEKQESDRKFQEMLARSM